MSRNLKRILLIVLLLVLGAAGISYYYYNKGSKNVQDSKGVKATAADLYTLYVTDTASAHKKYSGKVVEVRGQVRMISVNNQNEKFVLLQAGNAGEFINCTMEGNIGNIRLMDNITLKGLCSGIGLGDTDLGLKGDVYLSRCFLIK